MSTGEPADALAFDRYLAEKKPGVADAARALRATVLAGFPDAVETFDPADGLLAIGLGRSMRDFRFAIIPHTSHVNLQLADGADLPDPDGRIEGTGKRSAMSRSARSRTPALLAPRGHRRAARPSWGRGVGLTQPTDAPVRPRRNA